MEAPRLNGGAVAGNTGNVMLELSKQEALALAQLLDAAVRGQGLAVAEAALVLHRKLQQAVQATL